MNLFMRKRAPGEVTENTRWSTSTVNLILLVTGIIGGTWAVARERTDDRVRDITIADHGKELENLTQTVAAVDAKVTSTREIMQKMSGQLDGMAKEQERISRTLERHGVDN